MTIFSKIRPKKLKGGEDELKIVFGFIAFFFGGFILLLDPSFFLFESVNVHFKPKPGLLPIVFLTLLGWASFMYGILNIMYKKRDGQSQAFLMGIKATKDKVFIVSTGFLFFILIIWFIIVRPDIIAKNNKEDQIEFEKIEENINNTRLDSNIQSKFDFEALKKKYKL